MRDDAKIHEALSAPSGGDDPVRTVRAELLYLDLSTCGRCAGSWEHLHQAVGLVRPVLDALGVGIEVGRTHVRTEDEARALGFVSSPTILVNGADIAPELRESPCGPCTDLCGCAGEAAVGCRVWSDGEREREVAPVGLIAAALLRAALGGEAAGAPARPYAPSSSVGRFFAAQSAGTGACCGRS